MACTKRLTRFNSTYEEAYERTIEYSSLRKIAASFEQHGKPLPLALKEPLNGRTEFENMREQRLEVGDHAGYLNTFDSHQRLQPFLRIIPRLSDSEYWKLLHDVFTSVEVISPEIRLFLTLFEWKRPCHDSLMNPAEHRTLARMPDELIIWRGYGHKDGWRGMSWTLKRKTAEFFASYSCGERRGLLTSMSGKRPTIVEAMCRKSDVLAYFKDRKESEIIVNPQKVTVLREITA